MNNKYIYILFHFIILILIQGLVLQYVGYENINLFIYPLFILLLPFDLPHGIIVLLGFITGISIDIFYDGYGIHSSTTVLMAFARPLILSIIEPRNGYEGNQKISIPALGLRWFSSYLAIFLFFHIFFYFTLEDLSLSWFSLARILVSFIFSFFIILLYQYLFNSRK
jgi:hypothetical protein